ncbi:MAG: T9SS type A sorting domain-containing protein [Bacteroidota bacterium]
MKTSSLILFLLLSFSYFGSKAQVNIFLAGEEGTYTPANCGTNLDCDDQDPLTADICWTYGCKNQYTVGLPKKVIRDLAYLENSGLWITYGSDLFWKTPLQERLFTPDNSDFTIGTQRKPVSDSNGDLWVSGFDNSVSAYAIGEFSNGSWTYYTKFNSNFIGHPISEIMVDDNDVVWIGHSLGGVSSFDGTNWTFVDFETLFNIPHVGIILKIAQAPNGDIWAMDANMRLFQWNGIAWFYLGQPVNTFGYPTGMAFDPSGTLWMAVSNGGIYVYQNGGWGQIPGLVTNRFLDLAYGGGGKIWAGCDSGLYEYDGNIWNLHKPSNSGVKYARVSRITADTLSGEVYLTYPNWSNSFPSTISIFDGTTWSELGPSTQSLTPGFRDFYMSPSGAVWFKQYFQQTHEIVMFDGSQWNYLASPEVIPDEIVWDSNGDFWIGGGGWGATSNPVAFYNGNAFILYNSTNSPLPANMQVAELWVDASDNLWIASESDGLWTFDGNSWTSYQTSNSNINSDWLSAIKGDSQGTLWIMDDQGTLSSFDGNNFTTHLTNLTSAFYNEFTLEIDGNDDIWITSLNGLVQYDGTSSTTYNSSNSPMVSDEVLEVFVDDFDRKWISQAYNNPMQVWDGQNWTTLGYDVFGAETDTVQKVAFGPNGMLYHSTYHQISTLMYADSVWPGDADDDGIVNTQDILALGQAFGSSGTARSNPSLSWVGQPAPLWFQQIYNGTDYAFSDTDGSGLVDLDDTLAINLNFGLQHNKTGSGQKTGGVPLTIVPLNPAVQAGDTLIADVLLGTDSLPATNAYGLTFTVNYDPAVVDSGGIRITYANSWLGQKNTDLLTIDKDFYLDGKVEMGMSRSDQVTQNGYGRIARLTIIMIDDISGKDLLLDTFALSISNAFLMDREGTEIEVGEGSAEIVVFQDAPTQIHELNPQAWAFNQIENQQFLEITNLEGSFSPGAYQLLSVDGSMLNSAETNLHGHKVPLSKLSNGFYFLRIQTEEGVLTHKFILLR